MTDKEYQMCQKDPNLLWSFLAESEKRNFELISQLSEMREFRDLYYHSLYLRYVSLFACGCIIGALLCGASTSLLSRALFTLISGVIGILIGSAASSIFSGIGLKIEPPIFFQRTLWFSFLAIFVVILLFTTLNFHPI